MNLALAQQPMTAAQLLNSVRTMRRQREAEDSLMSFMEQSWDIIENGTPFVDNWHLHAIADHLEAVSNGEIENLIINIPPGCCKSILVSVMWPAWEWLNNPGLRYLGASYAVELSIRDSQKCRDIITSDWYQQRWPQVQLRYGADQKLKYVTTEGGWRIATSVGGRATGEHPDRIIIDDPHSAAQADSDAERKTALLWNDRTISSRGQARGVRKVVVMQRLHHKDFTGHLLAEQGDDYVHLCLPMEYESKRAKTTSIGWTDPRTTDGALLWPSLFPEKKITRLKRALAAYGTAGQLQQRPSPEGGGKLKIAHFQRWPVEMPIPAFEMVIQSYDTAFTEKTDNDPTACTVWGLFRRRNVMCAMLVDAWTEFMAYPQLRKRVIKDWQATYGGDLNDPRRSKPRKPDVVLVEEKGSGISLLQDLHGARIPAVPYNPGRADKISRANQSAPILELDCIYIPESRKIPGQFISWSNAFTTQLENFPNDEHDDYVDTFTQFIVYARDQGWFDLDLAELDEIEEIDYRAQKKTRTNPYGN